MKIEKIKVDEIIPYADNAKLHPERQIEQIRSSILEFGFNDPIAIDENNVVIEGNGRLMAINENSEVMYCCHKPYEIIGKLSDKDIWEKREQFQTNMSMCDIPCRLTAPNNFIQSLQDIPHDAAFI